MKLKDTITMKEPKYTPTVLEQAIEQLDKEEMQSSTPKQRGGARVGSGRKSFYGDAETAMYKLPKECADGCREYAKVMLANDGRYPMQCRDGIAIQRMQLPKGHAALIKDIERRWLEQGVSSTPHITNGYPLPDFDNIIIEYTDVTNLVEIVREYAFSAGMREGMKV